MPQKKDSSYYLSVSRVRNQLDNMLPIFAPTNGLFVYSSFSGAFIHQETSSQSQVALYLQNYLRYATQHEALDDLNTVSWFSMQIQSSWYLLRIQRNVNTLVGAWCSMDSLTSVFEAIHNMDADIVYLSESGAFLSDQTLPKIQIQPEQSLNHYELCKSNGKEYLLVTDSLSYCPYYIAAIIPTDSFQEKFNGIFRLFILALAVTLLFTILIIVIIHNFINRPLQSLQAAIIDLRNGRFDVRIPERQFYCNEFINVQEAFNDMVDEIHQLKIDVYEEQLAKQESELAYLKSQLTPHFFINCLSSISSLTGNANNRTLVQQIVSTLSGHLRYTLADRTLVSLKEELIYVENYIHLSDLRFPGCLHYQTHIEEETTDCAVLPLILLMYTENSIKYNLVMGEPLTISVSAHMVDSPDGKRVHLSHIDSGDGYSREFLAFVNRPDFIEHRPEDGTMIGHYNVVKRLQIVHGSNASIFFSNEPGAGARIDIEFPYRKYSIEKNIKSEKKAQFQRQNAAQRQSEERKENS